MNVTLFQNANGPIYLSAITSGGSQAMLFKVNTLGEEAFLDKLKELCDESGLVEKMREGVDEFILNKYSWQDVAESTCKLYKKAFE